MKNLTKGVELTTDFILASLLFVIVMGTFVFVLNLSPIGIETFDNDFAVLGVDAVDEDYGVTFSPNVLGTEEMDVFIADTNINTTIINYSFDKITSGYINYQAFEISNRTENEIYYKITPQIDSELYKVLALKLVIGNEEYLLSELTNGDNSVVIPISPDTNVTATIQMYTSANINFPVDFTLEVKK